MTDYYERKKKKGVIGCLYSLTGIIVLGFLCLMCLLCGCTTTRYVPVETVKTEYITKTDSFFQKDSVFLKDSVFIHSKNDTVWYERWHTKYIDKVREVVRVDSFIKSDSIQIPYPIEKKLTRWQQIKIDLGGEAIVLIVVVIFIYIWLVIRRHRGGS